MFIGKDLDKGMLREGFDACVYNGEAAEQLLQEGEVVVAQDVAQPKGSGEKKGEVQG